MAVIATPSSTANSYASNAEAIAVWQSDYYKSDWPTNESDQDKVLKMATSMLDDQYGESYEGNIYDASYALYWPRTGVYDPRTNAIIYDYTSYPDDLKRATALQAYHIFKNNRITESADLVSANISESLDGVGNVTRGTVGQQKAATSRPSIHPEVAKIMANWVTGGGTSQYQHTMYRG